MQYYHTIISSPVGKLKLVASDSGLCEVMFDGGRGKAVLKSAAKENHPVLKKAARQLAEYFAGARQIFDVPLDIQSGTPFQRKAWKALTRIPYGKTVSYREQAEAVGDARKARPVGQANGKNPLSIIVPCHRVIGASGKLTGYGGGLSKKEYLLRLERKHASSSRIAT